LRVSWTGTNVATPESYKDRNLLESAVARPFQTAFGKEIHRGVVEKGAALFHSLISNHPFGDGNKRTAVLSLQHFLLANGFLLIASQDLVYKLALETASAGERRISQDAILFRIARALEDTTIQVSELQEVGSFEKLITYAIKARRNIRQHPLNRLLLVRS